MRSNRVPRGPGRPQGAPRRPQDGPRLAQDPPRRPRRPKTAQVGPKTAPRPPKTTPRRPKTPPRRPQDGPKSSRGHPKGPQDAPGPFPDAPRPPPDLQNGLQILPISLMPSSFLPSAIDICYPRGLAAGALAPLDPPPPLVYHGSEACSRCGRSTSSPRDPRPCRQSTGSRSIFEPKSPPRSTPR